jgi:hypothetical protein
MSPGARPGVAVASSSSSVTASSGPPDHAWTWAATVATLSQVMALRARGTVDPSGDSYHGNFTLTQYHLKFDPNVPNSEFDTSEVNYQFGGTVTANRLSPR